MLKLQLLDLVKQNNDFFKKFVVDEMAKSTNRRVIRLPPYHCELNPNELVWAQVKSYVAANNKSYKTDEVRPLLFQRAKLKPKMVVMCQSCDNQYRNKNVQSRKLFRKYVRAIYYSGVCREESDDDSF
ncbi:unnamed protein product [Euphydryas editha]|uniref:Tc1-like transposase DDE domain-containing protein n=1 Tax=Euphydryas editha TaxID=104508 RepID=A0AAU9U599_EUPED|nr:unnamed protein product [Euphydryas editha]